MPGRPERDQDMQMKQIRSGRTSCLVLDVVVHLSFLCPVKPMAPHFLTEILTGWPKSCVIFVTEQELFSLYNIFEVNIAKVFGVIIHETPTKGREVVLVPS